MKYFGYLLLSAILLPSFAYAQIAPEAALQQLSDNVAVTVTPETPGPNTNVTISIDSYSTNLDSADITWTVEGNTLENGVGEKSLTLKTGALGTALVVNLLIAPSDGTASFQKTITINPTSVDLFWQADSYTPPFYEGKAMFSKQGTITFVAMPNIVDANGDAVNPQDIVYTWSKDNSVLGSLSGTGKNTLTLTDSILGLPMNISVTAATLDNTLTATNSITLQSESPLILFYENNPLYGILYNRELGDTFALSSTEVSVTGAPYYFSNSDETAGDLQYTWSLNGTAVNSPNQNSITLRQQQGSTGNSTLGLRIDNQNSLLQTVQKEIGIQFGNQTSL